MLAGQGDYIIFADADLATPPDQLPLLTAALADHDIALGSRVQPDGTDRRATQPLHRRLLGRVFHGLARVLGHRARAGHAVRLQGLHARGGARPVRAPEDRQHRLRRGDHPSRPQARLLDGDRARAVVGQTRLAHARSCRASRCSVVYDLFRIPLIHRARAQEVTGARVRSSDCSSLELLTRITAHAVATTAALDLSRRVGADSARSASRRRSRTSLARCWDRLAAQTPAATPFSRWTFHRAWWDAYGDSAHEQYLVCMPRDAPSDRIDWELVRAIVPLMHRHEVEPEDIATRTVLRERDHGADCRVVPPDAKAVFFGASYHADYATILCAPADLPCGSRCRGRLVRRDPRSQTRRASPGT